MPPRTSIEEAIARIWAEALHVHQVGIHDHFLDLGGDSLIAARIISRVLAEFNIEVPQRSLFETPTVADMAAAVVARNALMLAGPEEIERVLADVEGLTEEQIKLLDK